MDQPITPASLAAADAEFAGAWHNPRNTRFELPPADVNRILRSRYALEHPFQMTRTQLWDMELKKAWDPKTYIPYVVSEGLSWGRHAAAADGGEHFYRASMQKAWIEDRSSQILEEVFIDHTARRILFLGRAALTLDTGRSIDAGTAQPLFHVEHGAAGTEADPVNTWRIVFLTEAQDHRLLAPFEQMVATGRLQGFVEVYIERDLGVSLG